MGKRGAQLVEDSIKDELQQKRQKHEEKKAATSGDENDEEKLDAAPAVNLIRFLPELFLVERLLPSKLEFDTPDETPSWKPCAIPEQKAGMTRSLGASLTMSNVLLSNAYQEIYPRPRFSPKKNHKWYDFIDNGGRLITRDFGYFDPNNNDDTHNNKTALSLLELHLTELENALTEFRNKQVEWRCHRRQWEFHEGHHTDS
jgi:hypothetical protein